MAIHDTPKPSRKEKHWRNYVSTILGIVVAIANGWANVDWSTIAWDRAHVMPLIISAAIALGGYMTSINPPTPKQDA